MAKKSFSIRLDSELLQKISHIAAYEGRSLNRQLLVLINKCVQVYENHDRYNKNIQHGPDESHSSKEEECE